jgi:hypothetical protein
MLCSRFAIKSVLSRMMPFRVDMSTSLLEGLLPTPSRINLNRKKVIDIVP